MSGHTRRLILGVLTLVVVAAMAGIWSLSPGSRLPARFPPDECRKIALTDPRTGAEIVGVEDLALAPDGNTLILSAHDRDNPALTDGGLYALGVASLGGEGGLPLFRLDAPRPDGEHFRPHGIALDPETGVLAVINRFDRNDARVEVGAIGPAGWAPEWQVESQRLCRANDLDFAAQGLFVTIDRADCTTSLQDLVPWLGTGSVARLTPDAVIFERTGLEFPNGISAGAVAETRASAIRWPNGERLRLSGGPDNLAADDEGALIAAVHPSLARLFLMRQGVFHTAPTRILRISAGGGDIEILFDDPSGWTFSAGTVGVMAGNRLIVGSATDKGILVCEPRR